MSQPQPQPSDRPDSGGRSGGESGRNSDGESGRNSDRDTGGNPDRDLGDGGERSEERKRFASLYDMVDDDPDLDDPLWPTLLLGLVITLVLVFLVLWRAGIFGWPWPFEGII